MVLKLLATSQRLCLSKLLWSLFCALIFTTASQETVDSNIDVGDSDVCESSGSCGSIVRPSQLTIESATEKGGYPRYAVTSKNLGNVVWSREELAMHKGADETKPLLLCVLGEVFDVGTGKQFYGPGHGYNLFAGQDNSRSFADTSTEIKDDMSNVDGLPDDAFRSIIGWRSFYRNHETYRSVGYLVGRYYTSDGRPTEEGLTIDAQAEAMETSEAAKDDLKKRFKNCNSRSVTGEPYFEVWCSDGYHLKDSVPVKLIWSTDGDAWCACATADVVLKKGEPSPYWRFEKYEECSLSEQRCKKRKASQAAKSL